MRAIDLVLPGSGTRLPCLVGAVLGLEEMGYSPRRVCGTSGGGILALLIGRGDLPKARQLCDDFLAGKNLLDLSLWPFDRYGLYKGDLLYEFLHRVFGDATMGECLIPTRVVVCNLWTRSVEIIDSTNPKHAHLKIVDVAYCTAAIPLLLKARRLDPNNEALYVDGGTALNLAAGTFDDDITVPTVAVRFADQHDKTPRPIKSLADYAGALFNLRQDASNEASPSLKSRHLYLDIETNADGFDFSLTKDQVKTRVVEGHAAALAKSTELRQLFVNSSTE